MSADDGLAARRRAELRRRSELAEARISRGVGEPALFAVAFGAVAASIYFALGVVAGDALGLTPLAYAVAAVFFVVTMLTYVEGSSLYREPGGATVFARYAFDELWSFIAGWAILLDYLIVIAIAALAVPNYLGVFWADLGGRGVELAIAALVIAYVARANVLGLTAHRYRFVLQLSVLSSVLFVAIAAVGFAQLFDASAITDEVDFGKSPTWGEFLFATVVAGVALNGIEAAAGLAGGVRVGRRGLRRVTLVATVSVFALFVGISALGIMAVPIRDGETELGASLVEAPLLGIVGAFEPAWVADGFGYAVGIAAALVLVQAAQGQMLGIGRLAYSLGTNRQIPSLLSRLHVRYSTPFVAIGIAAAISLALAASGDINFLAGIFAFGATLAFAIAHLAVIVLRFREPDRPRPFVVPLSFPVGRGSVPLPAVLGVLLAGAAWVSVVVLHEGARYVGGGWMLFGALLYVSYRGQAGKPLRRRFTIPDTALSKTPEVEYGSILVPIFGTPLDDDIVGTAGRLASEEADETEGGAMLEVLWVFALPMSLPLDARVPAERVAAARRALAHARDVGEEYEGVEVATAMVRARTVGAAIVSEARRRGVEAIVLGAESPSRVRGGGMLGGRGLARERFADDETRYVIEKAPCKVILTAPPADAPPAEPPAG